MARLQAAGVRVLVDTFTSRQARGVGRFTPERMKYYAEAALADLEGVDLMLLAETKRPVAFFAYPDKPSVLVPTAASCAASRRPTRTGPPPSWRWRGAGRARSRTVRGGGQPRDPFGPADPARDRRRPGAAPAGRGDRSDEAITASQPIVQQTAARRLTTG
jgi:acetolactate synthase-1/2/3 large subunit